MSIMLRRAIAANIWRFYYRSEEEMFCFLRVELVMGRWEFFAHDPEKPDESVWVMSISRVQSEFKDKDESTGEFKDRAPSAWELLELLYGYVDLWELPRGIPEPYREQLTQFLTDWAEAAGVEQTA